TISIADSVSSGAIQSVEDIRPPPGRAPAFERIRSVGGPWLISGEGAVPPRRTGGASVEQAGRPPRNAGYPPRTGPASVGRGWESAADGRPSRRVSAGSGSSRRIVT